MGDIPELKSAAQIASELDRKDSNEETQDPKEARAYTFDFSYTDARGKLYAGKFTNQILTIKQRRQVKVTKAQMSGGVSVSALDADQWEMNEMIAHMAISLDRKSMPEWALDLEELTDDRIVYQLYAEVASHEATFRGGGAADPSGEAASG